MSLYIKSAQAVDRGLQGHYSLFRTSEVKTVFIRMLICYLSFSVSWVHSGLPEATECVTLQHPEYRSGYGNPDVVFC